MSDQLHRHDEGSGNLTGVHDPERGEGSERGRHVPAAAPLAAAVVIMLLVLIAGAAFAGPYAGRAAPTGEQTAACDATPGATYCTRRDPVRARLTPDLWLAMTNALRSARAAASPEADCDHMVKVMYEALARRGVPGGSLLWADGSTPSGERHAWLVVMTDGGDFALDILEPTPVREVPHVGRAACAGPNCWRTSAPDHESAENH